MPAKPATTTDLWEAIYSQRAIRYYSPEAVPEDLVWKVIEAATMAPSGTNLQPWRFVVIRDDAAGKRLPTISASASCRTNR